MRKAQAAMEYLMISGFVFMILLPMMYFIFNYTQESTGDIADAQLTKIGWDLVNTAESVYYYNNPSKITLEVNMPKGVLNMSIVTNNQSSGCTKCTELRFFLQKGDFKQTLPFNSKIEIKSEDYSKSEDPNIPSLSKFNYTAFSPGLKRFKIEAKKDHALISID